MKKKYSYKGHDYIIEPDAVYIGGVFNHKAYLVEDEQVYCLDRDMQKLERKIKFKIDSLK